MAFGRRARTSGDVTTHGIRAILACGPLTRTALAGVILGFGGVTAGTGFVQASERGGVFDFLGRIFGVHGQETIARSPGPEAKGTRKRYAALPDARRVTAVRARLATPRHGPADNAAETLRSRGSATASYALTGPRTVCVRTCDGYLFPLGMLRAQKDLPVHEAACAAACPSAATALFTLAAGKSELDEAVSLNGKPYLAAAWANVYRRMRVENCQCRQPGVAVEPSPPERDPTMRVGDIVATGQSAAVVTRLARSGMRLEDYRSTRGITQGQRRDIEARIGSIRRDADRKAFQRALRTAEPGLVRLRMAEADSARIRAGTAERDSGIAAPAPGFAPVRVLVPAPFAQ